MRIIELEQPTVGDIIEFETDPDTVVEGLIVEETADGYIYEFSGVGLKELQEACTYGKYFCSTDKKWKCRQGPKQTRQTEAANPAQQAAIAIAKKEEVDEEKQRLDPKCWTGYKKQGTKIKGGVRVNNCVKEDEDQPVSEAEYQGREVPLGKPMKGDVKKSKVYVRNDKGNVVKVNFGDPNMRIKKSSPKHRKSFRARHHCENPGPRWKARYWSCRAW